MRDLLDGRGSHSPACCREGDRPFRVSAAARVSLVREVLPAAGASSSLCGRVGGKEGANILKPSIGRIVHYVLATSDVERNAGEHRPAIITRVWRDECVQLQVFTDGPNDEAHEAAGGTLWRSSVSFNDSEKPGRTWHWPERE